MEKKQSRKNIRIDVLEPGHIISLKYDFMFTQIFNDPDYDFALHILLSDVLSVKKDLLEGNVEYLNRDLKVANKRKMLNKVDLLIKHKDLNNPKRDEYINVELNSQLAMLNRNKVFSNLIGANTLKRGNKEYKDIAKTAQINFNFFDDLDEEAENLIEIYQMRTIHGKKAYGFDDTIYNIFVNLGLNVCYNLSDERERRVADWCLLMTIDDEETFLRKATDIMGKEKATKLFKRVKELSADEDNIALYTDYTNQEMLMNTVMSTAEEMTNKAKADIAKAQEISAKAQTDIAKAQTDIAKAKEEAEKIKAESEKETKQKTLEKAKEIAKNLLEIGLTQEQVALTTGLSLEVIKKLS